MFLFHNKIVSDKHHYGSLPLYLRYTYSKETKYSRFISDKSINLINYTLSDYFEGSVRQMRYDPFFSELLVYYELCNIRKEYVDGVAIPIPKAYNISDVIMDEVECAKVYQYITSQPPFTENFYEYLNNYSKSIIACNLHFINYDIFFDTTNNLANAVEFLLSNLDEINYIHIMDSVSNMLSINKELEGMGKALAKVLSKHDVTKILLSITVGDNTRFYNEFVDNELWEKQVVIGSSYTTHDFIKVCDSIEDTDLAIVIKKLKASMILKSLTVSSNNF